MDLDNKEAIKVAKAALAKALDTNDISTIQHAISDAQAVFSDGPELDSARNILKLLKVKAKLTLGIKKKENEKIYVAAQDCCKILSQTQGSLRQLLSEEINYGLKILTDTGMAVPDVSEYAAILKLYPYRATDKKIEAIVGTPATAARGGSDAGAASGGGDIEKEREQVDKEIAELESKLKVLYEKKRHFA
jgi:hypothetical protein